MTSRAANPDIQLPAQIPGHVKQFRVSHGIVIRVPKSSQLLEEEARVVGRLHISMGHPSERAMIRLLGQHRVRPGVLDAVRGIDCEYCKRSNPPDPPHQVSMPRLTSGSFGDELSADIFFFVLPSSHETVPILGIICHHTNLHCAAILHGRQPDHVLRAFQVTWFNPFGLPHTLRTDGDGAFRSVCSDWFTAHGIAHNMSAGESPHLMGKIERHNYILKGCLTRLADEASVVSRCDLQGCLIAALHAKNSTVQRNGFSPFCASFGRHPRVPTALLDERNDLHELGAELGTSRSEYLRLIAIKALTEFEQHEAIRSAQLRLPPHRRHEAFTPGDRIAYWRSRVHSRGHGSRSLRPGYATGVYVCADPDVHGRNRTCWVHSGGRLLQCTIEQVRHARGHENYVPTAADWQLLEELRRNPERALDEAVDAREQPPTDLPIPEADVEIEDGLNDFGAISSRDLLPAHYSEFEVPPTPVPQTPAPLPGIAQSSTGATSSGLPLPVPIAQPSAGSGRTGRVMESHEDQRPAKQPRQEHSTLEMTSNGLIIQSDSYGWDGSFDHFAHRTGWRSRHHQAHVEAQSEDSEPEVLAIRSFPTDDDHHQGPSDPLGSKDKRAVQKEIPPSVILQQPQSYVDLFIAAAKKEESSWLKWKSVKAIPQQEAQRVLKDPSVRHRIMSARAAFRDKSAGSCPSLPNGLAVRIEDVQAKCRVVLRGYADPHLPYLDRHSPVALRCSLHTIVQVFTTYLTEHWTLFSADVSAAFLQGAVSPSRPESLFMKPPRDALSTRAGIFGASLYEVLSSIYGMADAPAQFNAVVRQKLTALGGTPHPLDAMLWLWFDGDSNKSGRGALLAILEVHVDDIIGTYSPKWGKLDALRSSFHFGSWKMSTLRAPEELSFCGKRIRILPATSSLPARVWIHQIPFASELEEKRISMRNRDIALLSPEERTEYRSTVGSLQWLAGNSRPDVASGCSLLQSGDPEVSHLRGLYESINHIKNEIDVGVVFYPLPPADWLLIGMCDASFNNAAQEKSQLGMMILLGTKSALTSTTTTPCTMLEWKSHRSRR
eukprot:4398430-Amphidinium_carterae.1